MTFDKWMSEVDSAVSGTAGVSVHDLPDCTFRDWFDDETPPADAAAMALEGAGFTADPPVSGDPLPPYIGLS